MANKNINTFSANVSKLITQQANTLNLLTKLQASMTTNDSFIEYDYTDTDGETHQYELPSYVSLINRIKALEETMRNLSTGNGSIQLNDGTRRTITLNNVPAPPDQITQVDDPTRFSVDSNWFFEDFMFPGATVAIDLTGQIPDTADRVKITRVILDSNNTAAQQLWSNNLSNNSYDYASLKALLSYNAVSYSEDTQTVELPLTSNTASGEFQILDDPATIDGLVWYTLNTVTYKSVSTDSTQDTTNRVLSPGDQLSYSNTIFSVVAVDQNTYKVRLSTVSGAAIPGIYTTFRLYQDPFREKTINVRFGAHEYDFIYIKAVDEDYNLLCDTWSVPVKFATDTLLYDSDGTTTFKDYYVNNIVDWGASLIADAKQRTLKAFYGQTPNAPTLNADDLRVVQINTQINAAIDTAEVKNLSSEIETTKSQISSLKSTIASLKTELQSKNLTTSEYNALQQQISTNTNDLSNMQSSYTTLVNNLKSIVKDNQAVNIDPKYHVRGFFPVPELKYRDSDQTVPEEIIGFEIAYRYICDDNTGTQLNTFTYTDSNSGGLVTGTFTDWVLQQGKLKTRVYNNDTGLYEWTSENVADGTEININQIDIAITKGERLEIKARSISEAGYPDNPLRSEWSNSVIVQFPDTLSVTNEIADLITEINDDAVQLTVNNTMDSLGVQSHLDDSIANTNSVNGLYFKHEAKNIAYENETTTGKQSISLQTKIDDLEERLAEAEATIKELNETIQSLNS